MLNLCRGTQILSLVKPQRFLPKISTALEVIMKYREQRRPMDRKITLRTSEGDVTGEMRDLSGSGMKLSGVSLPLGTTVCVPILGEDLPADVVFSDETSMGLRFDRTLTKEQLTSMISPGFTKGLGQVQRFREL